MALQQFLFKILLAIGCFLEYYLNKQSKFAQHIFLYNFTQPIV